MVGTESQQFPSFFFPMWPPCSASSFSVKRRWQSVWQAEPRWDREDGVEGRGLHFWTHPVSHAAHSVGVMKLRDRKQHREGDIYLTVVPEGSIMALPHDVCPLTSSSSPKFHNLMLQTAPLIGGPNVQYVVLGYFPFKLPSHVTLVRPGPGPHFWHP